MTKRKPRAYSEAFRENALELVEAGTKSMAQIARELDIHLGTLRNWQRVAQARGEHRVPRTRLTVEEENRQLRRENARLREEREILKKATAFFATDPR